MENDQKQNPIKILFTFILILSSGQLLAQNFSSGTQSGNLRIVPIVGYERVQKVTPTPRTKDRFYYGLRAVYGVPLLSAELQATQAKDTEILNDGDLTIKETANTGMLGIRSSFSHQSMLSTFLRAGGHARQSEIEQTENGVTTTTKPAVYLSPYAGTGLTLRLGQIFSLNAGITVIFTGRPKGDDYDYQTDLGFNINF